ncbi:hypothetical protein CCO03_07480 [Comamonas serinivorans]|uniref:Glycosyltransferase RgtA/B/C/D-like domain-containing protein n=1 Tax=Comamonas serinivorans TaxID=1082851 RepID=A0A1Y0EMA1_9BURK|nr:glycosyltransferase family 39 protein [Comamonas serinivorans]ARU04540.1 hypothetical protein CCO03_07480 [Comamonas serinivorans]
MVDVHRPRAAPSLPTDTVPHPPSLRPLTWLVLILLALVACRVLLSPSLSWDQNEQLVWSQALAWGYGPQPPLYTWLQWGVNAVLGPTVLSLAVVKHVLVGLTAWFMFLAARQIMATRTAWLAAFGLVWLPGIGWELLRDQTHTVMLNCAIAATWFVLLRQLRAPSPAGFGWLGLVMAWGVLSKYSYVLMAAAALLAALSLPAARRALLSRGWWLTPVIGLGLVTPHALWALAHWQSASASTLRKLQPPDTLSRLQGLLAGGGDLLVFSLLAALPWLLMARWAFGRAWRWRSVAPAAPAPGQPAEVQRLFTRYVAIVLAALLAMVLAGTSSFDGRWLQPLFLMLPLLALVARPTVAADPRGARRFLGASGALLALLWAVVMLNPVVDAWRGKDERMNWPVAAIGQTLRDAGFDGHGLVIAGHHTTGGIVRLAFPRAQVVVCDIDTRWTLDCVREAAARAHAQHMPLLQVLAEEPAPAPWWRAAWPGGAHPALQTRVLPYRWTDPARQGLCVEFMLAGPDGRAPSARANAAHPPQQQAVCIDHR